MNAFPPRFTGLIVAAFMSQIALADNPPQAGDAAIQKLDKAGLLERISTLASDEFGGRAPMSEGERLTLNYLETQFREIGLRKLE